MGKSCLVWGMVVLLAAGAVGCGGGSPTKAQPAAGAAPAGTAPPGAKQDKEARGSTTGGPPGGFKQGE